MTLARILLSIALLGCGSTPASTAPSSTAGDEAAAPHDEAAAEYPPHATYRANPILSVYVEGPDPNAGELEAGVPNDFHARIVVTNTGDAPVEVRFAHIYFELARRTGELVACAHPPSPTPVEGPDVLPGGRAHTYEAGFHCDAPEHGEHDVRAFLMFGAVLDESRERNRFYAGSYPLRVR